MAKTYSFRATDEEEAAIEAEAKRRGSATEVIRAALQDHFANGQQPRPSNLDLVLYEIVKNRAVLLRVQDMEGKEFTDALLEESGKDAEAYLTQRKSGKL